MQTFNSTVLVWAFHLAVIFLFNLPLILALVKAARSGFNFRRQLCWATLALVELTNGLTLFQGAKAPAHEEMVKSQVVNFFGFWVLIFPAIYLALGVSLVTNFICRNPK